MSKIIDNVYPPDSCSAFRSRRDDPRRTCRAHRCHPTDGQRAVPVSGL